MKEAIPLLIIISKSNTNESEASSRRGRVRILCELRLHFRLVVVVVVRQLIVAFFLLQAQRPEIRSRLLPKSYISLTSPKIKQQPPYRLLLLVLHQKRRHRKQRSRHDVRKECGRMATMIISVEQEEEVDLVKSTRL